MFAVKILVVLALWAVQPVGFRSRWAEALDNIRMAVVMGKRSAWWLRWMLPLSAVIGFALVLLVGWSTGKWVLALAMWPLASGWVGGVFFSYVTEPVYHIWRAVWYVFTLRWRKAYRWFLDLQQIVAEWDTYKEYQQIQEKQGEERALKWLAMMTREHPLSYRVPEHFDPELARKVEEIEHETVAEGAVGVEERRGSR